MKNARNRRHLITTIALVAALTGSSYGALTRDLAPQGSLAALTVSDEGLTKSETHARWQLALDYEAGAVRHHR